jgi:hypothetical protein
VQFNLKAGVCLNKAQEAVAIAMYGYGLDKNLGLRGGNAVICNICGNPNFVSMGNRSGVKCSVCFSLERHRVMALILGQLGDLSDKRILVLAPDKPIVRWLRDRGLHFDSADLYPELYSSSVPNCARIDLTDIDVKLWPSRAYDLIIHSHVVEHLPTTLAYPLFHLFRMMTVTGKQLACIPFMSGRYEESFEILEEAESVRRFGRADHVRRLGASDAPMHLGQLVNLGEFDLRLQFDDSILNFANIPMNQRFGLHATTTFVWGREDWKLGKLD